MKALVYEKAHAIENFALKRLDVAEPTLRDLDVLVEVRSVGINPGEAYFRRTRSAEPGGRVLLGLEFAGVIVRLGSAVKGLSVGDRVFGTGDPTRDGAWAERVAVDHRIIAKLPNVISFDDAASLPIGSLTAWEALFRDGSTLPRDVNRVLIIGGAGAVASLGIQLLKAKTDAFIISTASRPESMVWCGKMGADLVLDHSRDVAAQLRAAKIQHVDLVLSTAKTADNIGWIADVVRPFGHLSVVDALPSVDFGQVMSKAISLHTEMVFSRIVYGFAPKIHGDILSFVATLVVESKLLPIATNRLEGLLPETMKTAHALIETERTIGKVVIAA